MKLTVLLAAFLLLAVLPQHGLTPGASAAGDLSIAGTVWIDDNADGVRQPGEKGLERLSLQLGKVVRGALTFPSILDCRGCYVRTDDFGRYRFDNLEPGTYAVRTEVGGAGTFFFPTYPRRQGSGDAQQAVTLSGQNVAGVDFGVAFPKNVPSFRGLAWINAAPANDPAIRAFIGDVDCTAPGGILPTDQPFHSFIVGVAPASLVPGCGEPGKTVRFTVNGQPANETAVWQPLPPRPEPMAPLPPPPAVVKRWYDLDLTVGPKFAYFVAYPVYPPQTDYPVSSHEDPFSYLRALVDGHDCARLYSAPWDSRFVVVPSRETEPGCGYDGAPVRVEFQGRTVAELTWHSGRITDALALSLAAHPGPPQPPPAEFPERPPITPPAAGDAGLAHR